jgi:hypothetical protein
MRRFQIEARTDEDAVCLIRELAPYAPQVSGRSIVVELDERSASDLFALLAALDACLRANEIPSVRVEVDGRAYLLAPQPL